MNPRAIALQGIGRSAWSVALQGFYVEPFPANASTHGGVGSSRRAPRIAEIDQDEHFRSSLIQQQNKAIIQLVLSMAASGVF